MCLSHTHTNFLSFLTLCRRYSPGGEWVKSVDPAHDCKEQYLCTPSDLTWKTQDENAVQFDAKTACDGLVDAGISRINFYGDSYMRQIYAALLITLNGNYNNGSIADTDLARAHGGPECHYQKQFEEKQCGIWSLNHGPTVCGGRVYLDPLLMGMKDVKKCVARRPGGVALFSFGNYKVGKDAHDRQGVNDAQIYSKFFLDDGPCASVREYDKKNTGFTR